VGHAGAGGDQAAQDDVLLETEAGSGGPPSTAGR
jgi:hypothetical protein